MRTELPKLAETAAASEREGKMWLPSRLERSTLGDLLGRLHRGGVNGRLDLIADVGSASASLHFERGVVVRVDGGGPRLGERIATSWDERRRIDAALAAAGREGDLAGAALARGGLATPARVRDALEAQGRERIERLFTLRRADLRFRVAAPVSRGVEVALGPVAFLHGRPRAIPRFAQSPSAVKCDPLRDAFDALGLAASPLPSRDVVRRAFRLRATSLHPDRARDPDARVALARAFTELAAAYERALAVC